MAVLFTPSAGAPNADDANNTTSFRNVITPAINGTGFIQVTFQASSTTGLSTAHASFGKWSGTTSETTATPLELKFNGVSGFTIAAGASITSDPMQHPGLTFTTSDKIVVILDTASPGGTRNRTGNSNVDTWFRSVYSSWNLSAPATHTQLSGSSYGVSAVGTGGPVVRSFANNSYASRSLTTLTAPAGVAKDDILLCGIFSAYAGGVYVPVTAPVGWQQLAGSPISFTYAGALWMNFQIFWKRATGAEPASYDFTHFSTSQNTQGIIYAISGVGRGGNPVDVFSLNSGTGTASSATGVTTTQANDLLVYLGSDYVGAGTTTPPTGMTERLDSVVYAADVVQASAGATGNKTLTNGNAAGQPWSACLVAIRDNPPGPQYRSVSPVMTYATRVNTVVDAPLGLLDNDIMLAELFLGAGGGGPGAPTAPAGWTELSGSPKVVSDGGFIGHFRTYWKRAASEGTTFTWTHGSLSTQAVIVAYSNCETSGSPIDASSANNGTGTTTTATGVTTTVANDVLVWLSHDWTGSLTLNPPTGFFERYDGLVYAADTMQVATGATGNKTQTNANGGPAEPWSAFLVALKGVSAGGGVDVTVSAMTGLTAAMTGVTVPHATFPISVMTALTASMGNETVAAGSSTTISSMTGMTASAGDETVAAGAGVTLTTTTALTGTCGDETVQGNSSVVVTSLALSSFCGDETVSGKANAILTPTTALTASMSGVSVATAGNIDVNVSAMTGLTASMGSVTVDTGTGAVNVNVTITTLTGLTGTCGDESVTGGSSTTISLTGLAASMGDETVSGAANITVSAITGMTSACGNETVAAGSDITVSMLGMTGSTSNVAFKTDQLIMVSSDQMLASAGNVFVSTPGSGGNVTALREGLMLTMRNWMGN